MKTLLVFFLFLIFLIIMSGERVLCMICKKSFKNELNRITHHNNYHNATIFSTENKDVNIDDNNIIDDIMYSSYNENLERDKDVLKCSLCKKNNHVYANVNTLNTHIKKYHPSHEIDSNFFTNNNKERGHVDRILLEFLNNYNIEDSVLTDSIIDDDIAVNNDIYSFKNHVSNSLKNSNNFTLLLLNINSLTHKYPNIKFILDEEIADVLVIQETKLGPKNCDTDFIHHKYNMFRRDRKHTCLLYTSPSPRD